MNSLVTVCAKINDDECDSCNKLSCRHLQSALKNEGNDLFDMNSSSCRSLLHSLGPLTTRSRSLITLKMPCMKNAHAHDELRDHGTRPDVHREYSHTSCLSGLC